MRCRRYFGDRGKGNPAYIRAVCHLDAGMTKQGLELETERGLTWRLGKMWEIWKASRGIRYRFIQECYDFQCSKGTTSPKYPLMFSVSDVLLIIKTDVLLHFEFDMEALHGKSQKNKPILKLVPVCARTGEGMEEWADWLRQQVMEMKECRPCMNWEF